jgi:alpha-tubulin suppressor-like RCC1 family protein
MTIRGAATIRPVRRWLALLAVAAGLAACDAGGFFVDPAPDGAALSLAFAPGGADLARTAALLTTTNRLRVQIRQAQTVVLDTVLSFRPADEVTEVVLPLGLAATPATVDLEVELRTGRQVVLRGSRSVLLNRRQLTTAEVEVVAAGSGALAPVSHISGGIYHSCAVRTDGRAFCWGDNRHGQLGDGATGVRLTPVAVGGGRTFRQVHAGYISSCGLGTDGRIHCWGENDRGVLGIGDAARSPVPAPIASELRFESLTVGGLHACGTTADGRAFCWGYNYYGQLGNGSVSDSRVPVAAAPALRFRSLSAGYLHTCGVTTDSRAFCWGYNEYGQLGNGSTEDRSAPVLVAGAPPLQSIAGGGLHTCGMAADGRAFCWGYNRYGQLGNATEETLRSVPVAVAGATRFRAVVAGGGHTCGISQANQPFCWGYNHSGPLGTGTFVSASVPTPVVGGITAQWIGAGLHHTCAVASGDEALCWGYNRFGQLGDRSTVRAAEPGAVLQEQTPPVVVEPQLEEFLGALRILLEQRR